jgi:hypothetical protein
MTAQMASFLLVRCYITRRFIMTYTNQFIKQSLATIVIVHITGGGGGDVNKYVERRSVTTAGRCRGG